jgi:hypothetical protein
MVVPKADQALGRGVCGRGEVHTGGSAVCDTQTTTEPLEEPCQPCQYHTSSSRAFLEQTV